MSDLDSEDEDLKQAIAMSLGDSNPHNNESLQHESVHTPLVPATSDHIPASKPELGLAGLDRKAMEEERLARLNLKRQRSISPPEQISRKAPKLESTTVTLPSGARLTSFSNLVRQDQGQRKSSAARAANENLKQEPTTGFIKTEATETSGIDRSTISENKSTTNLAYPTGTVKKTWAFGFERSGDDVKLEEVLELMTLRTAVLSAFQWDIGWVLSKLRTPFNGKGDTKCVFVMQGKEKTQRDEMLQQTQNARAYLRLCFPPMEGLVHCMHSKLMLLFHQTKLRIAIPTANLLNFDWGETGLMENSVFMIDLPRLPEKVKRESVESLPSFAQELLFYLKKQGLEHDICEGILNFDFTATKRMAFVHTAGGVNYNDDAQRTGLPGLARSVRELHQQSSGSLQLDFAASSIGSLNDDFLRSVHSAARGEDVIAKAQASTSKAKAEFFKASSSKNGDALVPIREQFRIYFPTHDTVAASRATSAGTICLQRNWFEAGTFPRTCFRDYRSTRSGLLSHNKIMYARGKKTDAIVSTKPASNSTRRKQEDVAWVYVGSANLSKSAWGEVVYDRQRKVWKVNCRNWECGVVLPVPKDILEANSTEDVKIKREEIDGEDSETDVEAGDLEPSKKTRTEDGDSETESEDDTATRAVHAPDQALVDIKVFDANFPPPFKFPGERYGGKQPWYFTE